MTGCDICTGNVSNAELWDIDTILFSWYGLGNVSENRSIIHNTVESSFLLSWLIDRQDMLWLSVQWTSRQYWLQYDNLWQWGHVWNLTCLKIKIKWKK